jgi:hypothetical protein
MSTPWVRSLQPSARYSLFPSPPFVVSCSRIFSQLGIPPSLALIVATKVHEDGSAQIGEPSLTHEVCFTGAKLLQDDGLFVSIIDSKEQDRCASFLAVVRWLYRLAQTSDGMCRLISNALDSERLRLMMITDPFLAKGIVLPLHTLLLTLMADQQFKVAASRAYALAFAEVATIYSSGQGTSQNSLFGLSVQFLNRYIYVEGLITELGFFSTLSSSLKQMLVPQRDSFPETKTLSHRRYYPIISDLKVIFTLPCTSRYFAGVSFDDILEIFGSYQYLHPQERLVSHHVEFESTQWMVAFNLYIGISGLFDYFVNWFESPDSIESSESPISSRPLPTVFEHVVLVLNALLEWQISFFDQGWDSRPLLGTDPSEPKTTFRVYPQLREKSFHIFLHRYFSACIRECARFPHLSETIDEIQSYLLVEHSSNEVMIAAMLDLPLTVLVWETEIRAGLWRRNGSVGLSLSLSLSLSLTVSSDDERSNP